MSSTPSRQGRDVTVAHEPDGSPPRLLVDGDDPPSRNEVRQLDERIDARFHAASARFTTMDRRFAAVVNRVDENEHHCRSLGERSDAHVRAAEAHWDAVDVRIDLVVDTLTLQLDRAGREQRRTLLAACLATLAMSALLSLALAVVLAGLR